MLKRFAKWILRRELSEMSARIGRLRRFAVQHLPPIVADGTTDQADNISLHMDVLGGVYLSEGVIRIGRTLTMGDGDRLVGRGKDVTSIKVTD